MKEQLKCILLIDDNDDDNFFHEREINKAGLNNIVITNNSGMKALEYLKSKKDPQPDLIFLDINMPGMNGWVFLEKYNQLHKDLQIHPIIIILTTSDNISDVEKAKTFDVVSDYITKPLTKDLMTVMSGKYLSF